MKEKNCPFDVLVCDDTKPMTKFELTPEQKIKERHAVERLREKFFGKNDYDESKNLSRIAV